ncbi:hypothetical protein NW062_06120 [Mycoplasmopsis cynos]|nr:hypothetical protein NW062_06120 [Mycoplasmopsis cynos]
MGQNKTSFGEVTKLGVKLLTSNKGVSLAGLIEKTKDIEKVLNTLTKSDILSKDYSSLSDKEKEELENTLKETAHLINDKRIFNAVVPIITKKAKENNVDKKIDNIVENAIKEIETKDPSYKNASSEKKKEITEKYIKENINKLYENTKREDPKIEDKIKTLETVVGNLNENTKNDLIKEFDKVVPNDGELRKKINVTKTIEIFFDFLKEKNKKENEVKKEETSGINDSNLNDFINNLSGVGSEGSTIMFKPKRSGQELELNTAQFNIEKNNESKIYLDPQKQLSPNTYSVIKKEKRVRILSAIFWGLIFSACFIGILLNVTLTLNKEDKKIGYYFLYTFYYLILIYGKKLNKNIWMKKSSNKF